MSHHTTIIIPYNRDRGYLIAAIASAEAQPGCLVKPYHSDNRIGFNINRELECLSTPYWTVLAEDDVLPVNSIKSRKTALELTGADFCHGRGELFFPDGRRLPYINKNKIPTFTEMLEHNHICGGTPMYRAEVIEKYGKWNEDLWTGEEYWYHLNLLKLGAKITWVDRVVYHIRIHDRQKSVGNVSREYQQLRLKAISDIKKEFAT